MVVIVGVEVVMVGCRRYFVRTSVAPTNSGHFAKGYIAVVVVRNERRGPLEGANEVAEE